MKITVRQDKVVIDGYVNAVDRFSRPLFENGIGKFVEKILPNVFKRALAKAKNIDVYLNHDENRKLACTSEGTAKVYEDNVGLRAIVEIKDPEVIAKARAGKLRGWSFGFSEASDERTVRSDGLIERVINAITMHEVSIIDDRALPAYYGTSIETRTVDGNDLEIRTGDDTEIDTEHAEDKKADGGEEKPDKKENTDADNKPNSDTEEAEEKAKAELDSQRLAREADIRNASI